MTRSHKKNTLRKNLTLEDNIRYAIVLKNKFGTWRKASEYSGYKIEDLKIWSQLRGAPKEVQDIVERGAVDERHAQNCYTIDKPDDNEFIERVKFMIGKSGKERDQIILIIKEKHGIKIDAMKEKFEVAILPLTIKIDFTEEWAEGMRKAGKDMDIRENELAKRWIQDDLRREKYI
ncbi:MAG: hypothetical protein MOIL_01133 [Candidatus Methanolliviera sp. GoM_oil]|nr:MAG: hypothetical protein MOIL_01133 [Candidatus Methanolliviera sp. GoM_oil]